MHLIADSGSTKTEWRNLLSDAFHLTTNGLNPMVSSKDFILRELSNIAEMQNAHGKISEINFYGAGCSKGEGSDLMTSYLKTVFPNAAITVESDLMMAAKSVFGNESGVIAILGTGSNAAYFDGEILHQRTPSLGYIMGDQGAGMGIGKEVLTQYFQGNDFWLELLKIEQLDFNKDDLLQKIYAQERPNRFIAKYAQAVMHHLDIPECRDLLTKQLRLFFNTMIIPNSNNKKRIGFVGSVAFLGKYILEEVCSDFGFELFKIERFPINGIVNHLLCQE